MRHNQVINLISVTIINDDIGNEIEQIAERMIYANEMEVSQNEFYNAAATGLRPEKMFETYSFEYNNEDRLKHNDVIYRIVRSSQKGEKTRLVCEKVAADG